MHTSQAPSLRVALDRALGETVTSAGSSVDRVQRAFWTGADLTTSRLANVVSLATARAAQPRLRST
jgi:hypothetical protein